MVAEAGAADVTGYRFTLPSGVVLRQVGDADELAMCFPIIAQLRPALADAKAWVSEATVMAPDGYRVLAAWRGSRVLAVAGYRVARNLIHGRFLYVDDLVADAAERRGGLGAAMLRELSTIGVAAGCGRLVLDTAATNTAARRFYRREGLLEAVAGFIKPIAEAH